MTKRPVKHLSDEGRTLVDAIQVRARELNVHTQKGIWRTFLAKEFDYSVWNRFLHDDPEAGRGYEGDTPGCEIKLRQVYARMVNQQLPAIAPVPVKMPWETTGYVVSDTARAVFTAVEIAQARQEQWKTEQNRLVGFLAPFGAGKTELCGQLVQRYGARYFYCTQCWAKSEAACLSDLCAGLGIVPSYRSTHGMFNALIQYLRQNKTTLAIDNANTFAPHTCNWFLNILDLTPSVVVYAAIESFELTLRKKSYDTVGQLFSRAVAIVKARPIEAANVAPLLAGLNMNGAAKNGPRIIAEAAQAYGGYRLVKAIARRLSATAGDQHIDEATVLAAVATEEAYLRKHEQVKELSRRSR